MDSALLAERFDPVIPRALNQPEPFKWGLDIEGTMASKQQQGLFAEAAQFGIRHGFTVPIHDASTQRLTAAR
jgi:hypothetical protein